MSCCVNAPLCAFSLSCCISSFILDSLNCSPNSFNSSLTAATAFCLPARSASCFWYFESACKFLPSTKGRKLSAASLLMFSGTSRRSFVSKRFWAAVTSSTDLACFISFWAVFMDSSSFLRDSLLILPFAISLSRTFFAFAIFSCSFSTFLTNSCFCFATSFASDGINKQMNPISKKTPRLTYLFHGI